MTYPPTRVPDVEEQPHGYLPTSYTVARWRELTPDQRHAANRLMDQGLTPSKAISAARKSS